MHCKKFDLFEDHQDQYSEIPAAREGAIITFRKMRCDMQIAAAQGLCSAKPLNKIHEEAMHRKHRKRCRPR